jgi:menaquinone-dependent protoporphyrinogen oxidase
MNLGDKNMNKQTTLNRRRFLIGAGVVGAGLATCSGLGMLATAQPAIEFKELNCIKEQTMNRVLVAYASRAGATGEIAEAVGQVLCDAGATVEVRQAKDVTDLSAYGAVVLGSAIYMGSWMADATGFVKKHRATLSQMPLATFTVSMLMVDRPAEHQQLITTHFTGSDQPPRLQPVSNALFAGRIDYSKLSFFYRTIAKMMKAKEEDRRDWPAIRAWAGTLAAQLVAVV